MALTYAKIDQRQHVDRPGSDPLAYGHTLVDCNASNSIHAALDAGEPKVEFTETGNEFATIS